MAAGSVMHIRSGKSKLNQSLEFAHLKLFMEKLREYCRCGDTGSLTTGAAAGECCYLMPYHPIYYLLHDCYLNWKSWSSSQRETPCRAWGWHGTERPGGPHWSPQKPIIHHFACAPASHGMIGFNAWNPWESNTPSHGGSQLWSLDLSDSHEHSWRAK